MQIAMQQQHLEEKLFRKKKKNIYIPMHTPNFPCSRGRIHSNHVAK